MDPGLLLPLRKTLLSRKQLTPPALRALGMIVYIAQRLLLLLPLWALEVMPTPVRGHIPPSSLGILVISAHVGDKIPLC